MFDRFIFIMSKYLGLTTMFMSKLGGTWFVNAIKSVGRILVMLPTIMCGPLTMIMKKMLRKRIFLLRILAMLLSEWVRSAIS